MVLCSEGEGGHPGVLFKETGEVGMVFIAQFPGDLFYIQ